MKKTGEVNKTQETKYTFVVHCVMPNHLNLFAANLDKGFALSNAKRMIKEVSL